MGFIINIDEALKLRTDYNVLREPLNAMLKDEQEAWEKSNPLDLLFVRNTITTFQETYTSSIGFENAFAETGDYAIGPIFNTAEGFSATYRTRTFQGGFIITQQTLEDRQLGRAKDDASAFIKRWNADIVEYGITAISGGFGNVAYWGSDINGGESAIKLTSADTVDGKLDGVKNPLFTKNHTIVLRKNMTSDKFNASKQSNLFRAVGVNLLGSDPGKIAKLADVVNQIITIMENYKDDNNKRAGVTGPKVIVAPNDPHLKAALHTALSLDMFNDMGQMTGVNPAYKRATLAHTPYLLDIPQCANGVGFFIVDPAYNAANHGPEITERIPLTLNVEVTKRPYGIIYDGRQRFDINVASWRGIVYVYLGEPSAIDGEWNHISNFTEIVPASTIVQPMTLVEEVDAYTPVAVKMIAQISDGSSGSEYVPFVGNSLTLNKDDVLQKIIVNLNVPVTINGSPKSYIVSGSTKVEYGVVAISAANASVVTITPSGTNGECGTAGTFTLGVPADAVYNGAFGNKETIIILTVVNSAG